MSDHQLTMTADGGEDDLPRTLRREREARDREARERSYQMPSAASIMGGNHYASSPAGPVFAGDLQPAVVRHFDVPFVQLMLFCIKAVFAAIPAVLLLTVMLWLGGQALLTYFPKLVHTEIIIRVPR